MPPPIYKTMITNEQGQVALKYYQPQQRVLAQGLPSGKDTVFVGRANITMAWVEQEDVDHLLARYKKCCGGNKKKSYFEANENDVRQWTNGGGR